MLGQLLGPRPVEIGACSAPAPMSFNDIKQEYNNRSITTGAVAATANTLTLAATASSVPDAYAGYYVSITSGKAPANRYITGYDAANKRLTVEIGWNPVPDTSSQYRVYANGIPEFLIRLENTPMALPPVQGAQPGYVGYSDVPFNDISSYFCIPENNELTAYWDLVDDRLFKIRHCMNLAGQVRTLALFAPPINPRELIQAARANGGSPGLAAPFSVPIPYYRFASLIERAKADRRGLPAGRGTAPRWKSAMAKRWRCCAIPRKALLQMSTLIKQQQVEEAKQGGLALNQSLQSAQKQSWYKDQIDKGLSSNEIRTSST